MLANVWQMLIKVGNCWSIVFWMSVSFYDEFALGAVQKCGELLLESLWSFFYGDQSVSQKSPQILEIWNSRIAIFFLSCNVDTWITQCHYRIMSFRCSTTQASLMHVIYCKCTSFTEHSNSCYRNLGSLSWSSETVECTTPIQAYQLARYWAESANLICLLFDQPGARTAARLASHPAVQRVAKFANFWKN